jgi:hypothetical protein
MAVILHLQNNKGENLPLVLRKPIPALHDHDRLTQNYDRSCACLGFFSHFKKVYFASLEGRGEVLLSHHHHSPKIATVKYLLK